MFIKRSVYEFEMLKAFQSGRESRDTINDDNKALKHFATDNNFRITSLPTLPEYVHLNMHTSVSK